MKPERSMLVLNTPWRFKRGAVARVEPIPIRYRASRVYFGARYYRGVDFIVNIYEGGSLGCSRAPSFSPLHRRRRYHRPSCYRLLLGAVSSFLSSSPSLPVNSLAYDFDSWKIANRAHEKNKYDKRMRINSGFEILRR